MLDGGQLDLKTQADHCVWQDGDTPMHIAAVHGHSAYVEELVALGGDPLLTNAVRRTPSLRSTVAVAAVFKLTHCAVEHRTRQPLFKPPGEAITVV